MYNSISSRDIELYNKAHKKFTSLNVTDPTSMIAFMQEEIDFYRKRIDELEVKLSNNKDKNICSHVEPDEEIIGLEDFVKNELKEQQKNRIYQGFKIVKTENGYGFIGIEEENENL